jgi:hypothetical protein
LPKSSWHYAVYCLALTELRVAKEENENSKIQKNLKETKMSFLKNREQ